ncbi:hypothetical protein OAB57_03780, partial [Bacteriovoracaceae bacterium]|nr:hypothetical protein [Bacteriovoracaceae bacterium]
DDVDALIADGYFLGTTTADGTFGAGLGISIDSSDNISLVGISYDDGGGHDPILNQVYREDRIVTWNFSSDGTYLSEKEFMTDDDFIGSYPTDPEYQALDNEVFPLFSKSMITNTEQVYLVGLQWDLTTLNTTVIKSNQLFGVEIAQNKTPGGVAEEYGTTGVLDEENNWMYVGTFGEYVAGGAGVEVGIYRYFLSGIKAGTLDTSFGDDGFIVLETDLDVSFNEDIQIFVQRDHKIIVTFMTTPTNQIDGFQNPIKRLNTDGTSDVSFNGGEWYLPPITVRKHPDVGTFNICTIRDGLIDDNGGLVFTSVCKSEDAYSGGGGFSTMIWRLR